MLTPPQSSIQNSPTEPLADFRDLIARRHPEAIYGDACELALLLCCSGYEVEEAQRWVLEDGLEIRS